MTSILIVESSEFDLTILKFFLVEIAPNFKLKKMDWDILREFPQKICIFYFT